MIRGSREKPILLDVYYIEDGKSKPLVIFCHGFKGFKDWGHFPLCARHLAEAGFVVSTFNFSYNGTTAERPTEFEDLEAFGHNNITTELNDLGCVINEWESSGNFIPDTEVNRQNICLIGHSRGGGIAILKAAEDSRIKRLVTWAAVSGIGRMFGDPEQMRKWKEEGVIHIYNGRTHQHMPMYYQYYEDYINNEARLDIPAAASSVSIPWLIIHGTMDPTVDVSSAEKLNHLQPRSELLLIDQADHTFGGKHPWMTESLTDDSMAMLSATINFIKGF